ncbi:epoxyqueuosine reductase QueH [Candidatus Gracilibacteria bacterium]|nr:epoxyqueuosine reductase QueH [Candidatus Gracilibacteria bacterium]
MIYILGGAYDPPHAGHAAIVRSILHYKNPEKIIILPSGKRDDKFYSVSDEHRLAMLDIFVSDIADARVITDDYFVREWEGEMITRDVDIYARRQYGEDICHIFGTDTIESMPEWDEDQYAAKVVQKLFVPRITESFQQLEKLMEGEWCRFSPGEGGARGGYTEYDPSLREYATENRKNMNDMEKNMWSLLRGTQLGYKFHRQKPIGSYIVDFYTPNIQLIIEIDGESHIENFEYDNKRTQYFNSLGIHVLRFMNIEVSKNLEGVRENILKWIEKIVKKNSVTPPNLPFSGEELEHIQNYSFFNEAHIPDISSTAIKQIIPEYSTIHARFEESPKFIIPGLSKKISQYILKEKIYLQKPEKKPKILVHVCCGPDVTMPIIQLRDDYDIICFWYDPNIQPKAEYDKRYDAFVRICEIEHIPYIKGAYDVSNFFTRIRGVEHTPERGEKCTYCYDMRMMVSAKLAARLSIPLYTSSLNTSPKKDLEKLFKMGHKYGEKYRVEFLDIPFRKHGGFEKSVEYTREHDIYRQNYCGCIYSIREGGDSDIKRKMVG